MSTYLVLYATHTVDSLEGPSLAHRSQPVGFLFFFLVLSICLKISHPPIVAPIPTTPPPQRLRLGTAHLARFRIRIPLELGPCAAPDTTCGGKFFCCLPLFPYYCRRSCCCCCCFFCCCCCLCGRRRGGGDGGLFVGQRGGVGETVGDGALEAFEFGLFGGGEAWGGRGGAEGGGGGGVRACRRGGGGCGGT